MKNFLPIMIILLFCSLGIGCAKDPLVNEKTGINQYKLVLDNYDGPYYYQEEYTYDFVFN